MNWQQKTFVSYFLENYFEEKVNVSEFKHKILSQSSINFFETQNT